MGWNEMDIFDKAKCLVVCVGFAVALIATVMCPFTQAITLGMVGKLWLAYFVVQTVWAVLDGSMAEFITIMMSLLRR